MTQNLSLLVVTHDRDFAKKTDRSYPDGGW